MPNCGGLKYLPKAQVDHLQIGVLGYSEEVLLFRLEYIFAMTELTSKSLRAEAWSSPVSPVLVWSFLSYHLAHVNLKLKYDEGNSCFLFHVLFRRLCDRQPTALQRGKVFLIFDETGVHAYDGDAEENPVI